MAVVRPPHFAARRVVVLAGGDSSERAVSLQSGAAVLQALGARGHLATLVDPAHVNLEALDWTGCDVVFLALHGRFGEDGQVQELLERAGVPYTGSTAAASRVAFRKSASKERFVHCGVPTLPYVLIHESDDADRIARHAESLGYPLVVKPDAQGSSLGVSIVRSAPELPPALAACFHYDPFAILEPAVIDGSEWTVGILDRLVLPLIQIRTGRAFFDFHAKYEDDATEYCFDAPVPARVAEAIRDAGRCACEALGTRGIARADVMLDGRQQPWVLEVNTIPGMTDHSLVPKAAARLGMDFGELCQRALESALAMRPVRAPGGPRLRGLRAWECLPAQP